MRTHFLYSIRWQLARIAGLVIVLVTLTALDRPQPAQAKTPRVTPTPMGYVVMIPEPRPPLDTLEIEELKKNKATAALGNMPAVVVTDAEILQTIELYLIEDVWPVVVWSQNNYYNQSQGTGYIQGLTSHSVTPANGNHEYPDLWYTAPSDFPASWETTNILPFSASPYRYRIDTYNGPWGPGFVFCAEVELSGVIWSRCLNYGGELWREMQWTAN